MSFFLSSLTWGGHLKYLVKFSTIKEILFFIKWTQHLEWAKAHQVMWRPVDEDVHVCVLSRLIVLYSWTRQSIFSQSQCLSPPRSHEFEKGISELSGKPDKILRETNHELAFHPGDGVIPLFFYVAEIEVNYNNEVF